MNVKYTLFMVLSLGMQQVMPTITTGSILNVGTETIKNAIISAVQHVNNHKLEAGVSLATGLGMAIIHNSYQADNEYAMQDTQKMLENGTYGKEDIWNKIKRHSSYLLKKPFTSIMLIVPEAVLLYALNLDTQKQASTSIGLCTTAVILAYMRWMFTTI